MLENVKLIHACKLKCTYINRVLRNPTTMIDVVKIKLDSMKKDMK